MLLPQESEDEQLARAIAASLGQETTSSSVSEPASQAAHQVAAAPNIPFVQNGSAASASGSASASVTLPDGSCVVRRKVDDDNSCLFSAVGYVMEGSRSHATKLRQAWVRMIHGCLCACVLRIAMCACVCVCTCCFCWCDTSSLTARVCHVTPAMCLPV